MDLRVKLRAPATKVLATSILDEAGEAPTDRLAFYISPTILAMSRLWGTRQQSCHVVDDDKVLSASAKTAWKASTSWATGMADTWYGCCVELAMTTLSIAPQPNPHFERLGGHEQVVRLVDAFYRAMDTLPAAEAIRAMHEPDLGPTKTVLVKYLSEWMGGPRQYSQDRGSPMLRRRHHPFPIDADARDAWMLCMRKALTEVCVDEGLRAELDAAFYKIADFIRNTDHGGETRQHPGRPTETLRSVVPVVHRPKG